MARSGASVHCSLGLRQHGLGQQLPVQAESSVSGKSSRYEAQSDEILSFGTVNQIFAPAVDHRLTPSLHSYEDAMDILNEIVKKDETNAAARKQKVAIYKAQGQIVEAIKELTDYLKM